MPLSGSDTLQRFTGVWRLGLWQWLITGLGK
ncbi:hypothetical protein ACAN107058_18495 [Paracidovorax anthurii]|uniref:Uncharacterized protein n=1 Tax=Paracidovorax anthurii TaxID=78229 RepID=A0A328YWP1_9BURK|nr:hypothetical protein AX018_103153 [Paracidovorax anthurii]